MLKKESHKYLATTPIGPFELKIKNTQVERQRKGRINFREYSKMKRGFSQLNLPVTRQRRRVAEKHMLYLKMIKFF
jgi:hypothetical protein